MMKKIAFVLSLLLVLGLFAGCAEEFSSVGEKVDNLKDRAEDYLDSKGEQVGQYVDSAKEDLKAKAEEAIKEAIKNKVQEILPTDQGYEMSSELAEYIALCYNGYEREQVTGLRCEYEIDDGIPQYDVEYRVDGWEYEFEIHGENGSILSYDKDPIS